jgi:hypothetical protein
MILVCAVGPTVSSAVADAQAIADGEVIADAKVVQGRCNGVGTPLSS